MDKKEFESYVKAGEIAKQVVDFAKKFIKKDMLLVEVADKIEDKIKELKGDIAFPCNLSINEVTAHYTPNVDDKTKVSGLLKVDLGVEVNGYVADTAFSLDFSDDKRFLKMIEMNEKALENAINNAKYKMKLKEIGNSIQDTIKGTGYSVIRNLSGHSLGQYIIHSGLTIPNYRNENNTELEDIGIAIEPFLTEGSGEVYDSSNSEIYKLEEERQTRDPEARKLLDFIKENYKTKPFCRRWLEKSGFKKLNFTLSILAKQGILHNFPVLIEKSKKPVSQAEHTIVLTKDKVVVTTRD